MSYFSKLNILKKRSSTKSISKKTFRKAFNAATNNLLFVEKAYKREFGKSVVNNPDKFRKWYVSKYGAENLNDF